MIRVMWQATLAACLLAVTAAGCAAGSTRLSGQSLSVPGGVERVVFADEFDEFDWQRVYVFAPYSTRVTVEARLGFAWPEYKDTSVEMSDSVCLVVFVSDGAVVGWYEQSRDIDLSDLDSAEGYSRDEAVFGVTREADRLVLREQ